MSECQQRLTRNGSSQTIEYQRLRNDINGSAQAAGTRRKALFQQRSAQLAPPGNGSDGQSSGGKSPTNLTRFGIRPHKMHGAVGQGLLPPRPAAPTSMKMKKKAPPLAQLNHPSLAH